MQRNDDDRMVWEDAAEGNVKLALLLAEFTPGLVRVLDGHSRTRDCKSLDDLKTFLVQRYLQGWQDYVPYDEGAPAFEAEPWSFITDLLKSKYTQQITNSVGWQLP